MKYVVEVKEVHRTFCRIESDTPMDRAALLWKANDMIAAGEQADDLELEYDHTLEPEHWITRTESGDYVK